MDRHIEKRLLQAAVVVGCLVPLTGGLLGMLHGVSMAGHSPDVTLDSHVRYLSGLLFGVGLGFLSVIPDIEKHTQRTTMLTCIVIVGGLARLYGVVVDGWPEPTMVFALVLELGVVPMLWLWQRRVATQWT